KSLPLGGGYLLSSKRRPRETPRLSTLTTVEINGFSTTDHTDVVYCFGLGSCFPGLRRLKVHFVQLFCWKCQYPPPLSCFQPSNSRGAAAAAGSKQDSVYPDCARKLVSGLQTGLPSTVQQLEVSMEFWYEWPGSAPVVADK